MRPFRREPQRSEGGLAASEGAPSQGCNERDGLPSVERPRTEDLSRRSDASVKAAKMPKARRHRPWLRLLVVFFLAIEIAILLLVDAYSPVYDSEITMVYSAAGEEVGRNPELMYPVKLGGGTICLAPELEACVEAQLDAGDVCCTELFSEDSDGPEELISGIMLFGYVAVIPVDGAWGKKRWHLRVGLYSLDTLLGLWASLITALTFTVILKVTTGQPRPNYYALQAWSDTSSAGQTFYELSVSAWPSGHASTSMAGLLFLAFVLWRDLMALVQWRRRLHPRITLVLAVLGGFALAVLPLSAILIGIARIRDYWHRPDQILAGLVLGAACAFWSFRFVVVMPFNHEVGEPEWTPNPKWVIEEEDALFGDEEDEMGCWRGSKRRCYGYRQRPRVRHDGSERVPPTKFVQEPPSLPPQRVPEALAARIMRADAQAV